MRPQTIPTLALVALVGLVIMGAVEAQLNPTGSPNGASAEECSYINQRDYRGTVSTTRSGKKCQPWDSQAPHHHDFHGEKYKYAGLEANYCRNPGSPGVGSPKRAWCFTNDPEVRWEECDVPCPAQTFTKGCCRYHSQTDYRGTLGVTASGHTCQNWEVQTPHKHIRTQDRYHQAGLDGPYCRNPDGEPRLWCYTNSTSLVSESCNLQCDSRECCSDAQQRDYLGMVSKTVSGDECLRWDERCPLGEKITLANGTTIKIQCSKPPTDKFSEPNKFSRADMDNLGKHNYCRNPDGDEKAWCFTGNLAHPWDYCAVECTDTGPVTCTAQDAPKHTKPITTRVPMNIAFGSCNNFDPLWNDGGRDPQFWTRVAGEQPDMWVWLGDNIYANTYDNDNQCSKMQRDYMNLKNDPGYQMLLNSKIPVMSTWDDHDFGLNDEGKWYPRKSESKKRFLEFFDINDKERLGRDGVYNSKLFDDGHNRVRVVLLDSRFNRSPTFPSYGKCEGKNSTYLGQKQWKWLEGELIGDKLPASDILIIGSGHQILPPPHAGLRNETKQHCSLADPETANATFESIKRMGEEHIYGSPGLETWANGFPTEKERLLNLVQKSVALKKYKKVLFISGDTHWGEIQSKTIAAKNDTPALNIFEMTASGIRNRQRQLQPNFHRLSIAADIRGNGDYYWGSQCVFPFVFKGVSYKNCTTIDNGYNGGHHWCPTSVSYPGREVDMAGGNWGTCAPEGAQTKWGKQGHVGSSPDQWNSHPYVINEAISNYGNINIDFVKNEIRLQVLTPHVDDMLSAETVLDIQTVRPPEKKPVPEIPKPVTPPTSSSSPPSCEKTCCAHVHHSCCDQKSVCEFSQGHHDIHTVLYFDPEKKFLVNKNLSNNSSGSNTTSTFDPNAAQEVKN